MSLSVKFNGVELNEYIDVLQGFTPFSGVSWEPELISADGIRRGADFEYTSYKSKKIPMPFTMLENLKEKCDRINQILNVKEPKELVFGNAPDRVFYAVPMGDIDLDDYECFGEGTITWLVPDGVAHATVEKVFPAALNSEGVLEAVVVNDGTESAPVSYQIRHVHENGYIGIVSEYGVIQLGRVEECDVQKMDASEMLVNLAGYAELNSMATGGGVQDANNQYPMNGSFRAVTRNGVQYLALDNVGSGGAWHGASKSVMLPADSNGEAGAVNFYLESLLWFNTDKAGQTGALELVVGDVNGRHLASVHIVKSTTAANLCSAVFQIQGAEVGRVKYEPGYWSVTGDNRKPVYIRKMGELFEFCFGGKTYTYRNPAMAGVRAASVTLVYMQYGTRGAANLVTKMFVEYVRFRKDDVAYWYDVPNRYPAGSVVFLDGESRKVYVDGIPHQDDEVRGSRYFNAPPGETSIQFYVSDFCNPVPVVEARIREVFL